MKNTNKTFWRWMLVAMIVIFAVCGLTGCKKQEGVPGAMATEAPTVTPTVAPTSTPTAVPTEIPAATPTPMVMIVEDFSPEPEATPTPVIMETAGFSLTYSGLYAETVACKELVDTAEMDFEFTVTINGTAYTIFKTTIGAEDGDIVSMLNSPDGTNTHTPVSFYMNTLPEGLEGDDASTFYIAQEVVNEVIDTLTLL